MSKDQTQRAHWSWLATCLVCLLIFLIPSNLFLKFGESQAYVRGLLVDYLLPKLYLSDLVVGAFLLVTAYLWRPKKFTWSLEVFTVTALILRQVWSPYPLASFWYVFKLLEMASLALALKWWWPQLQKKWLWVTLVVMTSFQALLGLYQFIWQKSLAGYWLLGESSLRSGSGIATAVFNGAEKILPYGTTAHPNVLAGVLVVGLFLIWKLLPKQELGIKIVVSILSLVTLFLTQSLTAWTGGGFALLYLIFPHPFIKQKIWWIVLGFLIAGPILLSVYPNPPTFIRRRVLLNASAIQLWQQQPILGTGLNTNPAMSEDILAPQEAVRFVQPTHNLLLLWISETGLLGLLVLALLIKKNHRFLATAPLLLLLPIATFDHYLLTLQTGLLLGVFLLTLPTE